MFRSTFGSFDQINDFDYGRDVNLSNPAGLMPRDPGLMNKNYEYIRRPPLPVVIRGRIRLEEQPMPKPIIMRPKGCIVKQNKRVSNIKPTS
jgi:hypothetical protein